MMEEKYNFCPECNIGLNCDEKAIGKCVNCDCTWDPDNKEYEYEAIDMEKRS